jgi:hypothetical protein
MEADEAIGCDPHGFMRKHYLALILVFFQLSAYCGSQNREAEQIIDIEKALFEPDSLTNMTFVEHNIRSLRFTNVISNTYLFSLEEVRSLREILAKYENVTTNSPPPGSVLKSLERTNACWIAHYIYTNSRAHEDIMCPKSSTKTVHGSDRGYTCFIRGFGSDPIAKYRTESGDGYDIVFGAGNGRLDVTSDLILTQIRGGVPNGLFMMFRDGHFDEAVHLVNGKAIGKWFIDARGSLCEIKVKSPVDFFWYMTQEIKE